MKITLCFHNIIDQLLHHVNVLDNSQEALFICVNTKTFQRDFIQYAFLTLLLEQLKNNCVCVKELNLNFRLCFISMKIILTCMDSFLNVCY